VAAVVLCACGAEPPAAETEPAPELADADVAARVDGVAITQAELDAPLRIELHALDVARHELRRERLEQLIEARVGATAAADPTRVERLLRPPDAPRFTLDVADAPVRGRADAPLTLVYFIDYESPHARRMQPVLEAVLEAYAEDVRLALRDLPLPFHRNARAAARAAHCAGEQDAYWRMYDAMLLDAAALDREHLERAGRRAGVDVDALLACVDARRHAPRIEADLRRAAQIGVGMRVALFVGGRFVATPIAFDALASIVDEELGRPPRRAAPEPAAVAPNAAKPTSLPWSLDFVIPARGEARAFAGIRTEAAAAPGTFGEGDEVAPGVVLLRVEPRRVYLQRQGRTDATEYLDLNESPDPLPTGRLPPLPPSAFPEPQRVVTLERARVTAALADRSGLERKLTPTSATFSDRRLLVVERVVPGDLYDLLGLREGDVLMAVDGEWLTDQHNPLWQAAAQRDEIVLVFMRRGLPHSLRYRLR
jgi:protein-disulfide isomerase/type II secretory pathway component PulC